MAQEQTGQFKDLLTPEAEQELINDTTQQGIKDYNAAGEMVFTELPEEEQVKQANIFKDPAAVPELAQGITAAKRAKQPMGIGIVPSIFAAIAGGFSKNGAETTNKLMQQWSPSTMADAQAEREKNAQDLASGELDMEAKGRARDKSVREEGLSAARRDPNSVESVNAVSAYQERLNALNLPRLAKMFDGKSMEEADKLMKGLSPEIQNAVGKPQRDLQREDIKSREAQTNAFREATLQQGQERITAAAEQKQVDNERRAEKVKLEADRYQKPAAIAADKNYSKDYQKWTSNGSIQFDKDMAKLQGAKDKLQKAIDNGDIMTSGRVVGEMPDILRTEESRVVQQDVQESALSGIRAAMGSQFTENEGKRVLGMAYDPKLEPEENIKKIQSVMDRLNAEKSVSDSKAKYWEDNDGSIEGWQSGVSNTPAMVKVRSPDGKVGSVPQDQLQGALDAGYEQI